MTKRNKNKVLFVTVGGSPEPVITTIRYHKSEYIVFFASSDGFPVKTPGTHRLVDGEDNPWEVKLKNGQIERRPSIVVHTGLRPDQYEKVNITNVDSMDYCYRTIYNKILDVISLYPDADWIADYTGGTKTMGAALAIAAVDLGVKLNLVIGERINTVKVKDGTQRTVLTSCNTAIWNRYLKQIESSFTQRDYVSCQSLVEGVREEFNIDSKQDRLLQAFHSMARGFRAWDTFDHAAALDILRLYDRYIPQYMMFLDDIIKSKAITDLTNREPRYGLKSIAPVHDLLLNAQRRFEAGQYDDGIGRVSLSGIRTPRANVLGCLSASTTFYWTY
ncbi:MAG TPA: TIGR02710 family CRISPR-associated CARF protein [Methylomusa anaerophila]|uniref:CRISPR-associated protein n=1 Tax=Methylomusa anaerophila TaxID=1930071 RepID=A0A348ALW0_9FIRM|nr:TIGR02710 family CRISPR-associated CARF protein [Methylomusa anaerophila]BBB92058.1 CRISPR-associated protein [Methylomusa anaerophila]HML87930.1 TIGR02710 family CRISPR-associated CARF protein [Methylomusa anaerophila]